MPNKRTLSDKQIMSLIYKWQADALEANPPRKADVVDLAIMTAEAEHGETLKEVGELIAGRGMAGQDGSYPHFVRVEISEIEALKNGEMPK